MIVPSAYQQGLAKARAIDPVGAERYVAHTLTGDPAADGLIEALQDEAPAWIHRGIESGPSALADAPEAVRTFFGEIERMPDWFDPAAVLPGCRAFHRHSVVFLGAFVSAVLIEGFSTLIAKSFLITGRIIDQGERRLKQNNRHLAEIFLPGGLERRADGWKLSVRIRLVHAQIRRLLAHSPEWDAAAWGTPVSAAHVAFGVAAFSALLLKRAAALGVCLDAEERSSFMMIWRYAGHLLGVGPALLGATEAEMLHLHALGTLCEPPPALESIVLANGLINSAPVVAGITETRARRKLARRIYRISRALIGDRMASQLNYPPMRTFGVLAAVRGLYRLDLGLQNILPFFGRRRRAGRFHTLLGVGHYSTEGLRYRVPGHVHAEKDRPL